MKRADTFFNHAEISPQCVETHGEAGVWQEAARRLQSTFDQMLRRLKEQPNGRIVMAIGWKNPTNSASSPMIDRRLPAFGDNDERPLNSPALPHGASALRDFTDEYGR